MSMVIIIIVVLERFCESRVKDRSSWWAVLSLSLSSSESESAGRRRPRGNAIFSCAPGGPSPSDSLPMALESDSQPPSGARAPPRRAPRRSAAPARAEERGVDVAAVARALGNLARDPPSAALLPEVLPALLQLLTKPKPQQQQPSPTEQP